MTKRIRKTKALIVGVFRGLQAPADTFTANLYAYPHKSEQDAMRGDWERVGNQLRATMKQSDAKAAA